MALLSIGMSKLEGNKILKCIKGSMENLWTMEPVNKSPLYNSKIWDTIKSTRTDGHDEFFYNRMDYI